MAALLLGWSSPSPLPLPLLHLLFCSLFVTVPDGAARSHPAPGDTRDASQPHATVTAVAAGPGALAVGDLDIRPARTLERLIGPRLETAPSRPCTVGQNRLTHVRLPPSEPAPRTRTRDQRRLAWGTSTVQKGVVFSPFLAAPSLQLGKKRAVQRTRAHAHLHTGRVRAPGGYREGSDPRLENVSAGPGHASCHARVRKFTAGSEQARSLSEDNSHYHSNVSAGVPDAKKLDKRSPAGRLTAPRSLIDHGNAGRSGSFNTAAGNTGSVELNHRSIRVSCWITGAAAVHEVCPEARSGRSSLQESKVCKRALREFENLPCSPYANITYPNAHSCQKSKMHWWERARKVSRGLKQGDMHAAGSIISVARGSQRGSRTSSRASPAHVDETTYHLTSELVTCLSGSERSDIHLSDSPLTGTDNRPRTLFSVQVNFSKRSGDSRADAGSASPWGLGEIGESAPWTAPDTDFSVRNLLLWNVNNNNNNNNNGDIKDMNKTLNILTSDNLSRELLSRGPRAHAQWGSIPEENPHPACADSINSNSLACKGGAGRPQLKSSEGVSLQAEAVSQQEEQLGAIGPEGRERELPGEGREEERSRGKGNRQTGEGESEEKEMWVTAENTKAEASEADVNSLREGGKGQGGGSSQTETEADSEEARGDENKGWQEIKETQTGRDDSEHIRDRADSAQMNVDTQDMTQTGKESNEGEEIEDEEYFEEHTGVPPVGRSRRAANRHPHFPLYNYQVQVAENQPPGTSVISISAEDPDAGEAGRLSYSMAPLMNSRSMDYFHIDSITGLITTTHILDREHMDLHYFRVTATDHGSPRLSGTTMVAITVSDRNDHSPIFEQTEYRETIRENVEEGYPILQLRATDLDSLSNAEIRYRFVGESAAAARSAFEIDPRSGLITTRGIVDRELNERYTLQVEATDQGREPGPRSATVSVHIIVLDENDNVPQFSQKRYVVAVREDVRPHSEILRISASDDDKDGNAAVHYNIISGNSRGQFAIDSITGEIQVVAPLDFETEREYTLRLRAQDNGRPPLSNNTGIVSVQVTDVNDNPPIFVSTPFQATVLESAPIGHSILHIQAIDTDSGDNARLEYRLTGTGTDTPFVINAATGWVTVSSELDRESVEHYFFGVEARDYGAPPLSATASVTITVMDVNDNRPEFLQKEYFVRLNEDAAVGTSVVSVTAVDRDVNSAVTYQITGGNTRNRFAISTAGGAGLLSLALPLDYKQERRYVLTITASDRTLHDTCQVHVNITDANTHRPVFQSAHYSISVNEDRPPGSTVVVISASDEDVGENARITYFLEDNIPQFRIDPATGAITLQAELDYEDQMTYTLAITARDNGIPQKSDTTYVEVNVNDVNDNAPQFLSPRYQGGVSEDAPPFTSVLQISATDRDAHANGRVQYTFQNGEDGDGDFTIEPTSGIVRTVRRLDRESVPFYELTAFAVDRGVPPQRTPVHIQVSVMDVNDNAPVFPADDFEVKVKENSAVGSVVAQITATDPDEGPNAQIMYQIVEGNIPEIFQMDIFSGELTSLIDLDYETRNEYVIVVQATSAPLVSRATVRIRLVDQNDNRPEMQDFQIIFNNFVSNRSNTFPSGVIGRVPAHDPDVTDRLYYTIDRGNELHLLLLNHTSGEIRISRKLDNNRPLVAPMLITVTGKSGKEEKKKGMGGGEEVWRKRLWAIKVMRIKSNQVRMVLLTL